MGLNGAMPSSGIPKRTVNGFLGGVTAAADCLVTESQVAELIATSCPVDDYRGRKILLIIPDGTRTAPIGMMFKALAAQLGEVTSAFDILIALGTHPPMSEEAICQRLEISAAERASLYGRVRFFNHEWDNPAALRTLGVIPSEEIRTLSGLSLIHISEPTRPY